MGSWGYNPYKGVITLLITRRGPLWISWPPFESPSKKNEIFWEIPTATIFPPSLPHDLISMRRDSLKVSHTNRNPRSGAYIHPRKKTCIMIFLFITTSSISTQLITTKSYTRYGESAQLTSTSSLIIIIIINNNNNHHHHHHFKFSGKMWSESTNDWKRMTRWFPEQSTTSQFQ